MKVVIGMPWRMGEGRLLPHDVVRAFYARILPDAEVVEVDTDHQPYNLAAARNKAVREAEALGAGQGDPVSVRSSYDRPPACKQMVGRRH